MRAVLALALTLVALAAGGCGGDDETSTAAEPTTADTTDAEGSEACEPAELPAPRTPEGLSPPEERLDPERTYRLVFATSCGTFTVTLDQAGAPATAASLVALARDGYFDDTVFHRIVPGFVIQGGDPTQTRGGGPGYSTVDVPAAGTRYVKGVVAMAKTQAEPPGTSGSQFFVVTAEDAQLPPEYAVAGSVTDGIDAVDRIGVLGDESQRPTQVVLVERVTVDERP